MRCDSSRPTDSHTAQAPLLFSKKGIATSALWQISRKFAVRFFPTYGLSLCTSASDIQQKGIVTSALWQISRKFAVRFFPTYGLSLCTSASDIQQKGIVTSALWQISKKFAVRFCEPITVPKREGCICIPLFLVRVTGLEPARINTRS